jgi:hypothetical protein
MEILSLTDRIFIEVKSLIPTACEKMNNFSAEILRTRGGRLGSGMGALLEALWGYMMNHLLQEKNVDCEIAWFPGNQYNDFACLSKGSFWDEVSRSGELFRIEAKSMNIAADESKAHFDVLRKDLFPNDALLILVWSWKAINECYFYPQVIDSFFERSIPLTELRDSLHLCRGGSFVSSSNCPDGCNPDLCPHVGEPLNAAGKRERITGPENSRPSQKVAYAANFGGLVRMLKTDNAIARTQFRTIRKGNRVADAYISFIHRNFPEEEKNQFTTQEVKNVAMNLGIETRNKSKLELLIQIRKNPGYMQVFRDLPVD